MSTIFPEYADVDGEVWRVSLTPSGGLRAEVFKDGGWVHGGPYRGPAWVSWHGCRLSALEAEERVAAAKADEA